MALSHGRPRAAAAPGRGGGRLGALATAVLAVSGAFLALALWRADLGVPLRYTQMDDTKFYFGVVKDILDHGWYQHNPDLGAPFGLGLYDFPQGADNLNFLLIKALGLVAHGYGLVTNLFFLLTFPLTALAAYYAGRRLGLRPAVACVCGVLFSLLPYHFYRHESQVLLSAYYAAPLGAYLFLALFGADPLLERRPGGPRALAWASGRTLATFAICLVIGSAGLYYAAFSVLLLLAGTLVALVAHRGRGAVLAGAVCAAVIGLTLAANLSPSLLYTARHGTNSQIARTPIESEQSGCASEPRPPGPRPPPPAPGPGERPLCGRHEPRVLRSRATRRSARSARSGSSSSGWSRWSPWPGPRPAGATGTGRAGTVRPRWARCSPWPSGRPAGSPP